VFTVDHKQLGLMYIIIALLFFVASRLAGRLDPGPVDVSGQHPLVAPVVQPNFHDARNDDGVFLSGCRSSRDSQII
jgi:hypothetical protein